MALADITLNDGQGTPVAHTFTYTGTVNGRVVRSDFSAPAEEPLQMSHAHNSSKRNGVTVNSHLIKFDKTKLDSDGVTPFQANIRIAGDCAPQIYSDALADDFAAFVRNWATSANVRAWFRGSVG